MAKKEVVASAAAAEQAAAEKKPVTKEEIDAVMVGGPAVYANKALATVTPAGLRVSFVEAYDADSPAVLRAAVLLPYDVAISVRDLLTRQLKQIEAAQTVEIEFDKDGKPSLKDG
ncbi:hypothetical protein [Bauldia litoralis]|uniref:Uncharacterized protein n=1 Tax=Bauldia litoralis TaxID=665467 RepID=A0A1G6E3K1_9HYPH|nr:hypothetical protein [Bauldia litoralis]SDB51993.1 hypothetical protein SAMN02982931_04059 [Bauldia litoralis]